MCISPSRLAPVRPLRFTRWTVAAIAAVWFGGNGAAASQSQPAGRPLVLRDVTVIDATGAPAAPHRVVVVESGRITAVAPLRAFRAPAGAQVVDASGKFLIPGLWDMHVHLTGGLPGAAGSRYYLPFFVSFGVTGVRDMSGRLPQLVAWRDSVRRGLLLGPRMVLTGFKLGSQPVVAGAPFPIERASDIRESVRRLRQGGADFVKLETVSPELLGAAVSESRAQGLALVGHLPDRVTLREASAAGMRSVDHLDGVLLAASREEPAIRRQIVGQNSWWRRLAYRLRLTSLDATRLAIQQAIFRSQDAGLAESLATLLARNRTWQVPTLSGIRDVMRIR